MASQHRSADSVLDRSSQARLSELLNIIVRSAKAIGDEFGQAMGPEGKGWELVLEQMFPASSQLDSSTGMIRATDQEHPNQFTEAATTSNPASDSPSIRQDCNSLPPTRRKLKEYPATPLASSPHTLTPDQRTKEWKIIVHYSDVRAKMSHVQLAQAHIAFIRWWGWAPTVEEMKKAREAARSFFLMTDLYGPWCSPFATAVWSKALHDQSISKIKELKEIDWDKADQLAGFIGVTLERPNEPKAQALTHKEIDPNSSLDSLIVKLKMNPNFAVCGHSKPGHKSPKPTSNDPLSIPLDNADIAAASPLNRRSPPVSDASYQIGVNSDISSGIFSGLEHSIQSSEAISSSGDGIDPMLTIYQHPLITEPRRAAFDSQDTKLGPHIPPGLAQPASAPIASSMKSSLQWLTGHASRFGRFIRPHSQGQVNDPAELTQTPTPIEESHKFQDDSDHNANAQSSSDTSLDCSSEQSSQTEIASQAKEKEAEDEYLEDNEAGEKGLSASCPDQASTTEGSSPSSAHVLEGAVTPSIPMFKGQEARALEPSSSHYDYRPDITPDPRANALIAYILTHWRSIYKQNIGNDTAAMLKLGAHAAAAIPSLVKNDEQNASTRGLFRWDDQMLAWEITLPQIDSFVRARARQRKNVEKKGSIRASSDLHSSNPVSSRSSDTTAERSTSSAAPKSTPHCSQFIKPRPKNHHRQIYPNSSIEAIAILTPDSRVNAFAAFLAKSFYSDNGVDLMADDTGRYKLKIHATRNEHGIHGMKETANHVMCFYNEMDLDWKITGLQLDAYQQEWIKRFPHTESEEENDKQDTLSADVDMEENGDQACDDGIQPSYSSPHSRHVSVSPANSTISYYCSEPSHASTLQLSKKRSHGTDTLSDLDGDDRLCSDTQTIKKQRLISEPSPLQSRSPLDSTLSFRTSNSP